jgi:hypothetical protein
MRSVRCEPSAEGVMLVDIVCDCCRNGLLNEESGKESFKHPVQMLDGRRRPKIVKLRCQDCGTQFHLVPQGNHVHVNQIFPSK